jgi:hypothetical protein
VIGPPPRWCGEIRSPINASSPGKCFTHASSTTGDRPPAIALRFASLRMSSKPALSQTSRVRRQSAGLLRTTPVRVVFEAAEEPVLWR